MQAELDKVANKEHTHTAAEITDLQTELDKKANATHGHTIEEITNLQTELDKKANATHEHTTVDIIGLQTELNKRAEKEHTHIAEDITDLQTELDKKANATHGHTIEEITNLQTELDKVANNEARIKACEDKLKTVQGSTILFSDDASLESVNNMIKQTPTGNLAIGYTNATNGDNFAFNTFLCVHPSGSPRTFSFAVPKSYTGFIQLQQQSSPDGSAYENINWFKIPVCNSSNYLSLPGGLTVNGDATVSNSLTVRGTLNGHDIRLMSALKLLLQNSTPLFSNKSQCQEYKNLVYQIGLTPFAGSPSEVWVGDYRCYI